MVRTCSVPLLAACLTLCAVTPARAEEDKTAARELFRAGEAAFTRHEYRAAALAFEAADEKAASGGAMYNAAIAWLQAGEPARAADAFERALGSGELLDGRLGDARKRLAALERKLGVLVVTGPATVSITVAHLTGARPPRRVHLRPGDHVVHTSLANGERATRVVRVLAAQETKLAVGDSASSDPEEPARPADEQLGPANDTRAEARSSGSPLGWILVSAGAASALTGVFLLSRGLSARDRFEDSGRTDVDAHDRAIRYRTWSTVTLFGGAALAGTGAVLLLTSGKESGRPVAAARLSLELGPGSVSLVGRGL